MPRKKVYRSPSEEKEFQRLKHEKKVQSQKRRRELNKRNQSSSYPSTSSPNDVQGHDSDHVCNAPQFSRDPRAQKRTHEFVDHTTPRYVCPEISNQVQEHYIGAMNVLCVHCQSRHFVAEIVQSKGSSFNDCCKHGGVDLEPLPEPPHELMALLDGTHADSRLFFDRIRSYNSALSFASFNANLVQLRNRRPGPYCFKIQGQIYYQINTSIHPAMNENPSYGQLFIIDANEALQYRLNDNPGLDSDILFTLDSIMRGK